MYTVRNSPKFKDRANWLRDTFQPMRRRACIYQQTNQNIAQVIKNFQNNGRSRTELKGNSRENYPCFLSSLWFPNGM